MNDRGLPKRLLIGGSAGLVSRFGLQGLQLAGEKWLPGTLPPLWKDRGAFMVGKTPGTVRTAPALQAALTQAAAARIVAVSFAGSAGTLYAAFRPDGGNVIIDGTALGLALSVVDYLGWLPAFVFMQSPHDQGHAAVVGEMARYALFGIATVAAYRQLRRLL